MSTKIRTVLTAVAAAVLVAVPTTAQASEYSLWSTSGRSYIWFHDPTDRLVVCDMVSNDGLGAHAVVTGSQPRRERTVFNGCETFHQVGDSWWHNVSVCDWMYGDPLVGRYDAYCRYDSFQA
ncbi:hypothetical protein [Cellulomonas cellasea]|uniref:Secreted protein n=1 Tax=Cellulomonas cellasea TaxID=43670 RepID=A0A7W4UH45_9CELL|nr:hypothetical protein [Cellulomonas cellasea]MBB2923478.1 hypothetical protein [Cellulomonas cellasea]